MNPNIKQTKEKLISQYFSIQNSPENKNSNNFYLDLNFKYKSQNPASASNSQRSNYGKRSRTPKVVSFKQANKVFDPNLVQQECDFQAENKNQNTLIQKKQQMTLQTNLLDQNTQNKDKWQKFNQIQHSNQNSQDSTIDTNEVTNNNMNNKNLQDQKQYLFSQQQLQYQQKYQQKKQRKVNNQDDIKQKYILDTNQTSKSIQNSKANFYQNNQPHSNRRVIIKQLLQKQYQQMGSEIENQPVTEFQLDSNKKLQISRIEDLNFNQNQKESQFFLNQKADIVHLEEKYHNSSEQNQKLEKKNKHEVKQLVEQNQSTSQQENKKQQQISLIDQIRPASYQEQRNIKKMNKKNQIISKSSEKYQIQQHQQYFLPVKSQVSQQKNYINKLSEDKTQQEKLNILEQLKLQKQMQQNSLEQAEITEFQIEDDSPTKQMLKNNEINQIQNQYKKMLLQDKNSSISNSSITLSRKTSNNNKNLENQSQSKLLNIDNFYNFGNQKEQAYLNNQNQQCMQGKQYYFNKNNNVTSDNNNKFQIENFNRSSQNKQMKLKIFKNNNSIEQMINGINFSQNSQITLLSNKNNIKKNPKFYSKNVSRQSPENKENCQNFSQIQDSQQQQQTQNQQQQTQQSRNQFQIPNQNQKIIKVSTFFNKNQSKQKNINSIESNKFHKLFNSKRSSISKIFSGNNLESASNLECNSTNNIDNNNINSCQIQQKLQGLNLKEKSEQKEQNRKFKLKLNEYKVEKFKIKIRSQSTTPGQRKSHNNFQKQNSFLEKFKVPQVLQLDEQEHESHKNYKDNYKKQYAENKMKNFSRISQSQSIPNSQIVPPETKEKFFEPY